MQLWANRGYFVFFCNPIGSDGRGNRFADIRGHYGETDYRNLMDFTDAVLARYPQIDRKRLKKHQEKRMALGHKLDDHEEQWPDLTM